MEKRIFYGGCTVNDIDYKAKHINSRILDYLLFRFGYWFEHHKSAMDCYATLHLLSQEWQGKTLFKEMMEGIYTPSFDVTLMNVAYDDKDAVKKLGFRWEPSDKSWRSKVTDIDTLKENLVGINHNMLCETISPLTRYR